VAISVTESLWNRSAGLCGLLDGRAENDYMSKDGSSTHSLSSFINSWKVKPLGGWYFLLMWLYKVVQI
jgi:hypothetical protein